MPKKNYKFASVESTGTDPGVTGKQYIKMRVLSGICKSYISRSLVSNSNCYQNGNVGTNDLYFWNLLVESFPTRYHMSEKLEKQLR